MRVLLIEDDAMIARELMLRWHARGWNAEICANLQAADQARMRASTADFAVVVLDLGLPDGDGLHWLRRLREQDSTVPVIVVTARDRVTDRVLGLQGGADDYLVKPFDPDELDARIEALQRRGQMQRGNSLRYGRISWVSEEGCAYLDGRRMELLPREFEVLGLLLGRAPRVVSKRVLIDLLAKRNLEVGDSAIEVYVSRLRRKLDGSGTTIRTLRGFGYSLQLAADRDSSSS